MNYTRVNWTPATPISDTNLNVMDKGINDAKTAVNTISADDAINSDNLSTGSYITTPSIVSILTGGEYLTKGLYYCSEMSVGLSIQKLANPGVWNDIIVSPNIVTGLIYLSDYFRIYNPTGGTLTVKLTKIL